MPRPKKTLTKLVQKAILRSLKNNTMSDQAVANQLGLDRVTVFRFRKENNIPSTRTRGKEAMSSSE